MESVPPVLEPFSFGLQSSHSSRTASSSASSSVASLSFSSRPSGSRARVICGLTRGDLPVLFQWLKDGQPLLPEIDVQITNLDAFSSLLTIASLADRHSGNYTCMATNPAGQDHYTTALTVKGTLTAPQINVLHDCFVAYFYIYL